MYILQGRPVKAVYVLLEMCQCGVSFVMLNRVAAYWLSVIECCGCYHPYLLYGKMCGALILMPKITFAASSGKPLLLIQVSLWLTYYNGRLWKHRGRKGGNVYIIS